MHSKSEMNPVPDWLEQVRDVSVLLIYDNSDLSHNISIGESNCDME